MKNQTEKVRNRIKSVLEGRKVSYKDIKLTYNWIHNCLRTQEVFNRPSGTKYNTPFKTKTDDFESKNTCDSTENL